MATIKNWHPLDEYDYELRPNVWLTDDAQADEQRGVWTDEGWRDFQGNQLPLVPTRWRPIAIRGE